MDTLMDSIDQGFFSRWVLTTFGGWVLGVVAIVLLSELGELVGVGDYFGLGIGMGWAVGYSQWRVARRWFGATSQWMWATVAGLGMPFVLSDILGADLSDGVFVLVTSVVAGALLVSLWQRRTLQSHSVRANWWVPACIGGWGLAAALPAILTTPGPHLSNIGAIAVGGIALGSVTGGALVWMLRARPSAG
jgi:hypothetical protein